MHTTVTEDINNNAMKSMNQYILKRNPELIDRKVIEDIKAEIEETRKCPFRTNEEDEGLRIALQIINKHISGK